MPYSVDIQYTGFTPEAPQRVINAALRLAYDRLGVHFFNNNLDRRFKKSGAIALGYKRRSRKYNERKLRAKGHQDPMVFSGVTRGRALSLAFTRVNATATKGEGRVDLTLNAPVLNFSGPRNTNNGPNLREEITRIGKQEVPPLERQLERFITEEFNAIGDDDGA